jgi:uncharacterized membrane-anchored protein
MAHRPARDYDGGMTHHSWASLVGVVISACTAVAMSLLAIYQSHTDRPVRGYFRHMTEKRAVLLFWPALMSFQAFQLPLWRVRHPPIFFPMTVAVAVACAVRAVLQWNKPDA